MGGPLHAENIKDLTMIRPSTPEDVFNMEGTARDEDRKECFDLTGVPLIENLMNGYGTSADCITGTDHKGRLVLMAGVVPSDDQGPALVWMISTPRVSKNAKSLLREGRRWLRRMRDKHGPMVNVVTEENAVHRRLIKHMGFTFGPTIQRAGHAGVPVIPFHMR